MKRKPIVTIIFIFLIASIFLNLKLINGSITIGHDHLFHISNLILSVNNFSIFKPNVFSYGMNCDFGYGSGLFYPPLSYKITSIIGLLLRLINVKVEYAISIFEILVTFLSAISMFFLIKKIFKKNDIACLGSISYITAPYFLSDIYVRTALAELLTFIFIPIICLSIYELVNNNNSKFYILFIIGYVGMVLSHLIITLYLTIFLMIIFIINYKKFLKKDVIKELLKASIIVLLIVLPYIGTIIEHKIVSHYVFFNKFCMYNLQYFKFNIIDIFIKNKFPYLLDNVLVHNNYITLLTLIIVLIKKRKTLKNQNNLFRTSIIILIINLILMSLNSFWGKMPELLRLIQFPFRFCIFLSVIISVLMGTVLNLFNNKYRKKVAIVLSILILITSFLSIKNIETKKTIEEQLSIDYLYDYLPIKAYNNKPYYFSRDNEILIKKGNAQIKDYQNNKDYISGYINLLTDEVTLELPRFYYLGYSIKLEDNNKINNIKYTESEDGFINITIKESGLLTVEYKRTKLNIILTIISIVVIIIHIIYYLSKILLKNRNKNKKNR